MSGIVVNKFPILKAKMGMHSDGVHNSGKALVLLTIFHSYLGIRQEACQS